MSIKELVKELEAAAFAYYNKGESPLSDAEFDAKVEELRKTKPDHPFLKTVGAPPIGTTVKHEIPVGSQEKLKTREEFDKWCDQIEALTTKSGFKGKPFVIQHKLDGATVVETYKDGKLVRAVTRGDGKEGEDITANVMRMTGVKKELPNPFTGTVRGEILLRKELFEKEFKEKGYKNPRNTAAGMARDQKGNELIRFLEPVMFDIFTEGVDIKSEEQAFKLMKYFFPQVVYTKAVTREEAWAEYERIEEERPNLPFEIDGVIVRANSTEVQKQLGMSSDLRPKGQRCIKFEAMKGETILKAVELSIGHTGAIVPTGKLEPVEIGGVTVTSVLLNNFEETERLQVAIGDKVEVIRAGDVIPKVVKVIEQGADRQPIVAPETCPACGGKVKKDGANVFCTNAECEGKAFRKVKSWVTKRNIKYLGDELLMTLYENHGVKEPQDLYKLTEEFISKVKRGNGVVGSASKQIMAEINKSLTCPMAQFFGSLCIKFLGRRQCEIMVDGGIRTFEGFLNLTVEQLSQVPGFPVTGTKANTIVEGIKAAKPTIDALLAAGVMIEEPAELVQPSGDLPLSGRVVCFTGVRPKPLEQARFQEMGGVVKDSMSKQVTHLVVKDTTTTTNKATKARSLGIELVSYDDWTKWLSE